MKDWRGFEIRVLRGSVRSLVRHLGALDLADIEGALALAGEIRKTLRQLRDATEAQERERATKEATWN